MPPQKPVTWKPRPSDWDTELVSQSISPLTTSANSPSVGDGGTGEQLDVGRSVALIAANTNDTPMNGSQPPS